MKILAACHDAGGAEMVSSWLRLQLKWKGTEAWTMLDGPAEEIFRRKLPQVPSARNGLSEMDLVVCGSSFESALEVFTWRMAKVDGVRTAVYLDHWIHYRERFLTDDGISLPDEVWVTDRFAANLARRGLPEANVVIHGNPYADEVVAEARALRSVLGSVERILYLAEPGRPEPDEGVLERFSWRSYEYRRRPHPSVEVVPRSLAEDLAWADTILGYDSMALAVALRVGEGRRVVSLLPSDEELHIPWTGIERV